MHIKFLVFKFYMEREFAICRHGSEDSTKFWESKM